MRILFVALPSNIHALRWISQLTDQRWDIHLAPSIPDQLHPDLVGKVTFHGPRKSDIGPRERLIWLLRRWPHPRGSGYARRLIERLKPGATLPGLAGTIREIRPDIIHSLIIQPSGYATLAARKLMNDAFPPWVVGIWGSDIYFFGQLADHKGHIKDVLAACDYLACECARDIPLAREFGFTGRAMPVLPAGGGFDLEKWQHLHQASPTSTRRTILLKGYQHTVGRALAGLRALELCADVLQGYRILIQLASPDVTTAAEVVANRIGIPIDTVPLEWHTDYEEVMGRYGGARIHIGLSISDGISTSMLEAMVMGAFPIQSCTACADEWIEDGRSGMIVPPEDPHIIAEAIRRAVTDDALVDRAAHINAETARQRLAYADVKQKAIAMYKRVYADSGS